jgi:Squalene-hopene cyclase C-terminal domain
MAWLCRAQDATPDDGVSRSYALRHMPSHNRSGWLPSYPETTGYIIPTFLAYASLTGKREHRDRAIRMAKWEAEIQMENGAVHGGVVGFPPTPAIFNTGQVLFGWTATYRETGDEVFHQSARRGADFLVAAMDADGAWRRHGSRYARPGVNVYDARTAWGLLEAYGITGDSTHRDAVMRNLEFVLTKQRPNGWFDECCLDDNARPLLHTIAYAMEGLLEAGLLLGDERFTGAARLAADALLARQRPDGSLAGRFDSDWSNAAKWSCLTGDAQTAIVWLRLYETTKDPRYLRAAERMNRYLSSTQDLNATDLGIRGGIKGSQPIWGEYGAYEYLNWAAKF